MSLNEIPVTTLGGEQTTFGHLADGRLALVVNVASRCGLTPQYEQLEQLQRTYGGRGFTVIGFPSNQFLQELSNDDAIATYCAATWGVSFPMSQRVRVNGRQAHPLYKQLTSTPDVAGKAGRITWNFEKFLVRPDGELKRFAPRIPPTDNQVVSAIERWLPRAPEH